MPTESLADQGTAAGQPAQRCQRRFRLPGWGVRPSGCRPDGEDRRRRRTEWPEGEVLQTVGADATADGRRRGPGAGRDGAHFPAATSDSAIDAWAPAAAIAWGYSIAIG
jgi:hypothetical protein